MHAFEDLMTALKESNRPYDFDKITEAYQYASKAHEGQMRQSGDPYITHPIAVAQILVELGMDTETDSEIWRTVWTREERINNASTPMFLVKAVKSGIA